MTVLVAGATGRTGSLVIAELVTAGVKVRALSRSRDKLAALSAPGVEAVAAAHDDPGALRAAFSGVDAAYLATPSAPGMSDTEGAFARAAADAGVHVVKLSTLGATPDSPLRFGRMHAESEAAVEAVGGSWTFVQPSGFMQNDLAWAAQTPSGTIAGPVMDAAWSIVDARDVAAVAAVALREPATYRGRRLAVTGPEARTPRSRVAALARILGRELAVIDVPVGAFQEQLRGYGMSAWEVDGLAELFTLYSDGFATAVSDEPEAVTGRRSRAWEAFAADHQAIFLASGAQPADEPDEQRQSGEQ